MPHRVSGRQTPLVISLLERRAEIGLRRALGATRGHIRVQFLGESILLSGMGGIGGEPPRVHREPGAVHASTLCGTGSPL
jgi:FtsX-like permease family